MVIEGAAGGKVGGRSGKIELWAQEGKKFDLPLHEECLFPSTMRDDKSHRKVFRGLADFPKLN